MMRSCQDEIAAVLVHWIRERQGIIVDVDMDLFDSGTLDSFGFIEMIEMIEDTFATSLQLDGLTAPDARTVAGLARMLDNASNGE